MREVNRNLCVISASCLARLSRSRGWGPEGHNLALPPQARTGRTLANTRDKVVLAEHSLLIIVPCLIRCGLVIQADGAPVVL